MKATALLTVMLLFVSAEKAEETNIMTRTGISTPLRIAEAAIPGTSLVVTVGKTQMPVWVMEPLDSKSVRELFPDLTCYRLISSQDIVHGAHISSLLIHTNGSPTHLESDEDVADFLGDLSRTVNNEGDAKLLAQAFADLRSYRIAEKRPTSSDARKEANRPMALDTDYKFIVENGKEAWRVYATLFTSDYSNSFERYIFTIYKPPGSGIVLTKPVLIHLGNYVY